MRVMYDDIFAANVPDGGDLYAGYDDGNWPDADALAARFAGKKIIRVTVFPADNEGDVLDVEKGDANPSDAPGWVQRRRAAGAWPSLYCNESNWRATQDAIAAAGLTQPPYWIAHYTGQLHMVPGSVATQWESTDNYDINAVADFWPGIDPWTPGGAVGTFNLVGFTLDPHPGADAKGRLPFWGVDAHGHTFAFNGARGLPSPIDSKLHDDIIGLQYLPSIDAVVLVADDGAREAGEPGGYAASTFVVHPV